MKMEKCLDSQLWHACAGGMVQMPPVNSKVFYFPQGHAEHAQTPVDFGVSLQIPGLILCRVASINFLADSESDEVYAKLRLVPVRDNEFGTENGVLGANGSDHSEKTASFAKTLTQSDANNGGGFSVPRYCAETFFPRLDYSADPPVQTVIAKDVHGEMWKFRHIYRGTPRRHLLTTGWSSFVNQKKLIAGDSIVFLRADNGDLCIGIRRAKRGIGGGPETPQLGGWNPNISHYGVFSMFMREDEKKIMRSGSGGSGGGGGMNLTSITSGGGVRGNRKLHPESVIEAASLATSGQPFEVVYYPRASTPEFCVKASAVKEAMQIQWYPGMRFKMAFETEDSSRISWFMGTISSVQVADTIRWPSSPWRLLQVTWDEPDLLQNVKRVSPWLVELVSNMPVIHHMSPFSPPRKKLCLPQHMDFPFDGQIPLPSFIGNPLGPNTPPAGIQGARHAQVGISLSDLYLNNKYLNKKLTPSTYDHRFDQQQQQQQSRLFPNKLISRQTKSDENVSCLLTMGISSPNVEKSENVKMPHFLLFGQPILTEEQINCSSGSSDAVSQVVNRKCSSEEDLLDKDKVLSNGTGPRLISWQGGQTSELGINDSNNHYCTVFTESHDVGQKLDLSVLGSYEELYRKLAKMLGLENSERLCQVLYRDVTGALKHAGDEPFSNFMKTAKKLTVLTNGNGNNVERKWMTGLGNADSGLESSSKTGQTGQTGHMSIFA